MKKWKAEDGLTLVEMLAALSISGLIVMLMTTVLIISVNSYERISVETALHHEANLIVEALQNTLQNIDTVREKLPREGPFTSFEAVETIKRALDEPVQHITQVELQNGQLRINGVLIHHERYLVGGNFRRSGRQLQVTIEVRDPRIERPLYVLAGFLLEEG